MKTIPLTQGQVALVDDSDFEALSKFKWHAHKRKNGFHARCHPSRTAPRFYMHSLLLEVSEGGLIDHKDGNGLNNQRSNLRRASVTENARGFRTKVKTKTSRFRGVTYRQARGKWEAGITVDNTYRFLGRYASEKEAAQAYDRAALHHFGEFAHVNFPDLTKFETLA